MKGGLYIDHVADGAIGVHAIVSASNPDVKLGSGVSDHIGPPREPDDCLATSASTSTTLKQAVFKNP